MSAKRDTKIELTPEQKELRDKALLRPWDLTDDDFAKLTPGQITLAIEAQLLRMFGGLPDVHKHICSNRHCNYIWEHDGSKIGPKNNRAAHTCARCGCEAYDRTGHGEGWSKYGSVEAACKAVGITIEQAVTA